GGGHGRSPPAAHRPGGAGLHRRTRPGHPRGAVRGARRLAAWGDGAARDLARLGVAVRPRLRDPGRRAVVGPAHLPAPDPAPSRSRVGGRHGRRGAGVRPRLRSGATLMALSGRFVALAALGVLLAAWSVNAVLVYAA